MFLKVHGEKKLLDNPECGEIDPDWCNISPLNSSSEGLEKYLVGYQPRTSIHLKCGYLVEWGNGTDEGGQGQARCLACSCF